MVEYNGFFRGVVTNIKDPENLRRIKVKVPQINGDDSESESFWVWPILSTKRPPAVGSGTWITFINGNPDYPIWIGEFGKKPQGVFCYGSFSDTTTQTASSINTAYAVKLNTTELSEAVKVTNTSRITVDYDAVYNLQFSLQLLHDTGGGGGSGKTAYIWLRKNGTNVANSSSKIILESGESTVAAWNFLVKLKKKDYVQLMWSTDTTNIKILHNSASSPSPAIPSAIVTMTQIA